MTPRLKKLLGIFILLPGLTIYLFAAAALGEKLPDFWLVKLVYFAAAGVAWAFPIKHFVIWMNADPKK